jgi:hypothetical protein
MTTLATALNGAATLSASTAPTMGSINSYNASSGALTPTLQALSSTNVGATCIVEKNVADTSFNTVVLSANGSDTFDDGTVSLTLFAPGDKFAIQCVSISGTKYWKILNNARLKQGIIAKVAQVPVSNTTTNTTIITATLPSASLTTGATFRIKVQGSIQNTATSGTLTFTPNIQGTALATAVIASLTSSNAVSAFWSETDITVRTLGSSGTAIAKTFGLATLATSGLTGLTGTSSTATTVNTTSSASSTTVFLQAQWATANANNVLLIETATIERIV